MANFEAELPTDIIKEMEQVSENTEEIFGAMTEAGADVVYRNIKANVPQAMKKSNIMNRLIKTKTYKTPFDGGINTKVGFYGYFRNENGEKVPAPLVAIVFEYGRSNLSFPKHPFLRRSFKKEQIKKAMLEAQKKASGGLLDDE